MKETCKLHAECTINEHISYQHLFSARKLGHKTQRMTLY